MRLSTYHDTSVHVKYSHNAEERVVAAVGRTYVYRKDITVLFYGPVLSGTTGVVHERSCSITLERADDLRIWNVTLGTPIDAYENDRNVPEGEIPENILQVVNTFIETFEK